MTWVRRAERPVPHAAVGPQDAGAPMLAAAGGAPAGLDWNAYDVVVAHAPVGAYTVDRACRVRSFNPGATTICGWSAEDVVGHPCQEGVLAPIGADGKSLCAQGCRLTATVNEGGRDTFAYFRHKQGFRVPVKMLTRVLHDAHGNPYGMVDIITPVAHNPYTSRNARVRMDDGALDVTTGVATEPLFRRLLSAVLPGVNANLIRLGMVHVTIDNYPKLIDEYGVGMGDRTIRMAGQTIAHTLRSTDLAARVGQAEFIVALLYTTPAGVRTAAQRIRMLLNASWLTFRTEQIRLSVSVGATMAIPGEGAEALIHRTEALAAAADPDAANIA